MRLLCEYSDGITVSLLTALQRDPYGVRGLVCDAFFQCLAALPDTISFLRAEHSVRDALITFDGNQDRYVKAYVVSRNLDSRTKITPRAPIIQSSFATGGPLALIGVFYATFNVSRNPRNRETLDYLLGASPESRNELFERARTFPRDPSTGLWFQRMIDGLEPDAQSLAYLLVCLGPRGVPAALFSRVRQPSRTWGSNGEIVLEHNTELPPFLSDAVRFTSALNTLQSIGFLKSPAIGLHGDQQLAGLIENHHLAMSRGLAAEVICHAFPKHQSIEPNDYSDQCTSILPCLQHVLSFPPNADSKLTFLSQAIESCLSSLTFGDTDWKSKAISYAEHLLSLFAGREPDDFDILSARVAVAKASTKQLERIVTEQDLKNIEYPRNNHRSNAFAAELVILKAQVQIDLNDLAGALQETSSFDECFDGTTSALGAIMSDRVEVVRATIFRFGGRFFDAYTTLQSLPPTDETLFHFSAVLCERGDPDKAIRWLGSQLQITDPKSERLRLAWAHAHLFKCMQTAKDGQQDSRSLQVANETYLSLAQGIQSSSKLDIFSILVAQAILHHLKGDIHPARKSWYDALHTLRSYGLPPGYYDAIISFSLSDLASREHGTENKDDAGLFLAQNPHSHRFLGLGSLWPTILLSRRGVLV